MLYARKPWHLAFFAPAHVKLLQFKSLSVMISCKATCKETCTLENRNFTGKDAHRH